MPVGTWIDQRFDLPSMMAAVAAWLNNVDATFVTGALLQAVGVSAALYLRRDRQAAKTLFKPLRPLTPPKAAHPPRIDFLDRHAGPVWRAGLHPWSSGSAPDPAFDQGLDATRK